MLVLLYIIIYAIVAGIVCAIFEKIVGAFNDTVIACSLLWPIGIIFLLAIGAYAGMSKLLNK